MLDSSIVPSTLIARPKIESEIWPANTVRGPLSFPSCSFLESEIGVSAQGHTMEPKEERTRVSVAGSIVAIT